MSDQSGMALSGLPTALATVRCSYSQEDGVCRASAPIGKSARRDRASLCAPAGADPAGNRLCATVLDAWTIIGELCLLLS